MTDVTAIRSRYLDASSAAKLVVPEAGSNAVREYFEGAGPFYMTYACALEVFSVLKVKHFYRKELSRDQYFFASYAFSAYLRDQIKVEPLAFAEASAFFEIEDLARRHNLDLIDGAQLHTLLKGRFSNFSGPHRNLLITADEQLASAARAEGIDVWDCVHEPKPSR
jgi:predicted nucleic acid-binding protein